MRNGFSGIVIILFSLPLLALYGSGCGGGEEDGDGDGFTVSEGDCDDISPGVYPGADEIADKRDNDCDGIIDEGTDGYDDDEDGWSEREGDCDDGDEEINPGAEEEPYNGVDEDCDGTDLTDVDGDGFDGEEAGGEDCDDEDPDINPDAEEVPYNGVDEDCNGFDEGDVDGDGFVALEAGGDDCDDEDENTYPGAAEIPYDGIDQDCDGTDLTDVDGDGYDSEEVGGADCNDDDPDVNPGMDEICADGVDNDCNGSEDDRDLDGDTYIDEECGGEDCDDGDALVNPGMNETPDDWMDNDCDGLVDETDLSGTIEISDAPASFTGEAEGDIAGYAVEIAPDMDGDGYDDIVIGAPYNDDGALDAGKLYIFSGSGDISDFTGNVSLAGADLAITGTEEEALFGFRVAAGDFNNDGYGDVVTSAVAADILDTDTGGIYIFFGGAGVLSGSLTASDADVIYSGEGEYDFAGWSLAGGGDVNGDGRDDILVSADRYELNLTGEFYLILGRVSGWPSSVTSLGTASSSSFTGEVEYGEFSEAINNLSMGDMNGDSYDDIVIGEPRYDNSRGKVYIVPGSSTAYDLNSSLSEVAYSFVGIADYDYAAFSLGAGADVTGDGYNELLVSSPLRDYNYEDDGVLYLIAGSSSGWSTDIPLSTASSYIIYGTQPRGQAGLGEIDFGDLDGDGFPEFLFGSPNFNFGMMDNGMVTIYFGGEALSDQVNIYGEEVSEYLGYSLSTSGDINQDGYNDLLISSIMNDDAATDAGKIYLLWGND